MNKLFAALCVSVLTCPGLAGDLQPPPGGIKATMKPLDQLEPRRCVNDLPGDQFSTHTITQSGNYYLCADVLGEEGKSGISVLADNVTIDGQGFRVVGAADSVHGITASSGGGGEFSMNVARIELTAWGGSGLDIDGGGIASSRVSLEDVSVHGCGGDGVVAQDCADFGMSRVTSNNNGGNGVHTTGCVRERCSDSSCSGNLQSGFRSNGSGSTGRGVCRYGRCFAISNQGDGWNINRGDGTVSLDRCEATDNMGDGMEIASPPAPLAFVDVCVQNSSSSGNGGDGVRVRCQHNVAMACIRNARCVANGGSGVDVEGNDAASISRCVVDGCPLSGNGAHGLSVRVLSVEVSSSSCEGNTLTGVSMTADCSSLHDVSCFRNGSHGVAALGPISEAKKKHRCTGVRSHCNLGDGMTTTDTDLDAQLCELTGNVGRGLHASGSGVCKAGRCTFASNGGGGVVFVGLEAAKFFDSSFSGNTGDGMTFTGGSTLTVERCEFDGNTGSGLACTADNPTFVADSRFVNNPLCGAWEANGAGAGDPVPHFARCSFDNNGIEGLYISGARGGEIVECTATGNGAAGLRFGAAPTLAATGMRIDRCYAAFNNEGIVVDDRQNFVQRCTAASNTLGNLRINAENASGPNTQGLPQWAESKPYAWP